MIIALDLGTKTGYAVQHESQPIVSGVASFQPGRYEGGGMRYLRFRRWLDEFVSGLDPNWSWYFGQPNGCTVYFEEVRRHMSTDASHVYGGLLGHLTAWCEERGIPYQGVPVGTIKKCVTGKGNASKDEMIAAVRGMGFKPIDDNEADALAILHWAKQNG